MALKYFFTYEGASGNFFRCELNDESFDGDETEIQGRCRITHPDADNHLTPIRGSGLFMELIATEELTFEDLVTDDERVFEVELRRNGVLIWNGWVKPDGIAFSFADHIYPLTVECTDGLGFLENNSYVQSSGDRYEGLQSGTEIIANCLLKTNLSLNINISTEIIYSGMAENQEVLSSMHFNTNRYFRDDGETIMDCKEVLESVLTVAQACIVQRNAEWWVYAPAYLAKQNTQTFKKYDALANFIGNEEVSSFLRIGSHINGAEFFHVNSNQSILVRGSLGGHRVNYKYGLEESIYQNPTFIHDGNYEDQTVDDTTTIDGWTILASPLAGSPPPPAVALQSDGAGIFVLGGISSLQFGQVMRSNAIAAFEGDRLTFEWIYTLGVTGQVFRFRVRLVGTSTTEYWLTDLGEWTTTSGTIQNFTDNGAQVTYQVSTTSLPEDGDIFVELYQPGGGSPGGFDYSVDNFKVFPTSNQEIEGENHTVQRTGTPSTIIKETQEVDNGDNETNIYFGSLYQNNETTLTSFWSRKGFVEDKPILRLLAEQTLRISQSPAREFTGDVYGYFDYLKVVQITNLAGLYMILGYEYDTFDEIISLKLLQIHTNEISDIDYKLTFDFGEVTDVTIVT